jgi:hypothetical protein
LIGFSAQSVFGRLASYEEVNDADRLSCDPAMRWVVGDWVITGCAACASQMGRFGRGSRAKAESVALQTYGQKDQQQGCQRPAKRGPGR